MEKYIALFLSVTWFTLLFNLLILTTTVFFHELGHLFFGYLEGCYAKIVAFNTWDFSTYTELECVIQPSIFVTLGGLIFTLIFSFTFNLLNLPEKSFSLVILGLSFILALYDLSQIGIIIYLPGILGSILIIYGEIVYINRKIIEVESLLTF